MTTLTEEQKQRKRDRTKQWRLDHIEERKAYDKKYREEHLDKRKQYEAARNEEIKAQRRAYMAGDKINNPEKFVARDKATQQRRRQIKLDVMQHYGNICQCCGEKELEFLTIDHINGGGTQHRKQLKNATIYGWLKKNNYPDGFRVLCMNCNFATRFKKECPHKRRTT